MMKAKTVMMMIMILMIRLTIPGMIMTILMTVMIRLNDVKYEHYDDNESNERDPKSTGRVINSGGYCWLDQIQFIVPQLVVQRLYIYTIDTLPFLLSLS